MEFIKNNEKELILGLKEKRKIYIIYNGYI